MQCNDAISVDSLAPLRIHNGSSTFAFTELIDLNLVPLCLVCFEWCRCLGPTHNASNVMAREREH